MFKWHKYRMSSEINLADVRLTSQQLTAMPSYLQYSCKLPSEHDSDQAFPSDCALHQLRFHLSLLCTDSTHHRANSTTRVRVIFQLKGPKLVSTFQSSFDVLPLNENRKPGSIKLNRITTAKEEIKRGSYAHITELAIAGKEGTYYYGQQ